MGAAENRNRPDMDPGTSLKDQGLRKDAAMALSLDVLLQFLKTARAAFAAAVLALVVQLILVSPVTAAEPGGTHTFDALFSLTGGTGASKVDPVPDPGSTHPPLQFRETCGLTVDTFGNLYVSSYGNNSSGTEGRIDIFKPDGEFIAEIKNAFGPCDVGVDSAGVLYVSQNGGPGEKHRVVRYIPSAYPPTSGVDYGAPTEIGSPLSPSHLAVDPSNDHLYMALGEAVYEFSSTATGNVLLDEFGDGVVENAHGLAINSDTGDIFVGSLETGANPIPSEGEFVSVVYVFGPDHKLKGTIDGSDVPAGGFSSPFGELFPSVDEETGEVFVADIAGSAHVYRFVPGPGGVYEYSADPELEEHSYTGFSRSIVSNVETAENYRHLFVTSSSVPISHVYAFAPESEIDPPTVAGTRFSRVTATEAILEADITPNGASTNYIFEYIDDATFLEDIETSGPEHGFDHASLVGGGNVGAGAAPVLVSHALTGLTADTAYHFRVRASNECEPAVECVSEGEREGGGGAELSHVFSTFPLNAGQVCPNVSLRVGPSAGLPDCRAYELVSPPEGSGHYVTATELGLGGGFPTYLARPDGESVIFGSNSGALAGFDGNGIFDLYRANRSSNGWITGSIGPNAAQSETPRVGGVSADHGFSFWRTGGGLSAPDDGSLVLGGETTYIRFPDGTYQLLGEGPLASDIGATIGWMSPNAGHIIFRSKVKLVEGAPEAGTVGVYDRTSDGGVHVVSLLPGDTEVPSGSSVQYRGASEDGSAVAFLVIESGTPTLYVRLNNAETIPVVTDATFAGLSTDGAHLTYLKDGDIFSFDTASRTSTPIGSGGKSVVVNVSKDGSHVYFISPQVLASPGSQGGEKNLYLWNANTDEVSFIAIVLPEDVAGEFIPSLGNINGLGLWINNATAPDQTIFVGPGVASSRTSPDGRYLVFEARASLTSYDTNEKAVIYRYDSEDQQLLCVSCRPDLAPPSTNSHLQTLLDEPTNAIHLIENVTSDGKMTFFQSNEPLVPDDTNGIQDVYEWEAAGTGACTRPNGCISLISGGQGPEASHLYGVSANGRDVFFTTTDRLISSTAGGIRAIYDARIDGGFPPQGEEPAACSLDSCQSPLPPPPLNQPASSAVKGPGNVKSGNEPRPGKRCRKGQQRAKRHGKVRCVPKKKKQQRTAGRGG
jgi:hypothetical protein